MPKAIKKKSNASKRGHASSSSKPFVVADEGQTYGLVLKTLGDRHFTVLCQDYNKERLCHVRGKMLNRNFVKDGDIVLVALRDVDDDKTGDIIDIYPPDHVRILRKDGELTLKIGGDQLNTDKEETDLAADAFNFDNI